MSITAHDSGVEIGDELPGLFPKGFVRADFRLLIYCDGWRVCARISNVFSIFGDDCAGCVLEGQPIALGEQVKNIAVLATGKTLEVDAILLDGKRTVSS